MNVRKKPAGVSLILLCLFYIIMLSGGNYEQMIITKVIVSAPPKSFAMLTGEYRFTSVTFWATFRPITILLFIVALVLNWNVSPSKEKLCLLASVTTFW